MMAQITTVSFTATAPTPLSMAPRTLRPCTRGASTMRARFREPTWTLILGVHRPAATGSSTAAAAMSLSTSPWPLVPLSALLSRASTMRARPSALTSTAAATPITASCTTAATTTLPSTIPWPRRSMPSKPMASMMRAIWLDFIMTAAATRMATLRRSSGLCSLPSIIARPGSTTWARSSDRTSTHTAFRIVTCTAAAPIRPLARRTLLRPASTMRATSSDIRSPLPALSAFSTRAGP